MILKKKVILQTKVELILKQESLNYIIFTINFIKIKKGDNFSNFIIFRMYYI